MHPLKQIVVTSIMSKCLLGFLSDLFVLQTQLEKQIDIFFFFFSFWRSKLKVLKWQSPFPRISGILSFGGSRDWVPTFCRNYWCVGHSFMEPRRSRTNPFNGLVFPCGPLTYWSTTLAISIWVEGLLGLMFWLSSLEWTYKVKDYNVWRIVDSFFFLKIHSAIWEGEF